MSLANFFDKAALAASSILKRFDWQLFANALETKTVGVYFDSQAAQSSEAKIGLELTINLLARLYPRLAIQGKGESAKQHRELLVGIAREINPQISLEDRVDQSVICVAFGASVPNHPRPIIHVGSDGWIALVSTQGPVASGNSSNPFGSATAACIGVANVFRFFFSEQLEAPNLDKSITLSLVDLDPTSASPQNPSLRDIDLQTTHLVGIGAIGNGAIWVLRKIPCLKGVLQLVDHEAVELTNLQRYVLTTQKHLDIPKTLLGREKWSSGLTVNSHQFKWADYLASRADWNLERVAVAVDSAGDRCAIQSALPRSLINGWTRGGNLGISRHSFLGNQACLACLYLPESRQKNEDELIAEALGLPDAAKEIRHLLFNNIPVNANLISRVAASLQIDPESLSKFEGKAVRVFYTEAVCGGTLLRLTNVTRGGVVEVPMVFQSALAGILLAAEILIAAGKFRTTAAPTITQFDLLKPIGMFPSSAALKDAARRCICQDSYYISAYQHKYSAF